MKIHRITYPSPFDYYNKELFRVEENGLDLRFGTVFLKKGTRIPKKGFSRHPQHEISIIVKGKIEMLNEDESVFGYLNSGDAVHVKAKEAQAGNVLEDTELIYFLTTTTI